MILDKVPATQINQALGAIPGDAGIFDFSSCKAALSGPNIEFTIGGVTYSIPPSIYVMNNGGQCFSGIASSDGPADSFAILGDTWIKAVYTIFDKANSQVGFAKSINVK